VSAVSISFSTSAGSGGRSVVEAKLVGFLGELVQGGSSLHPAALLEVDEVLEPDPAMAVGLLEGNGAVFEELDEGRAADPEEVGRLLGGEEQPLGGDEGGLALSHDVNDLTQDAVDLCGKGNLLAVRAKEQAGLGVTLDEAGQVEQLVEVIGREDDVLVAAVPDGGGRGSAAGLAGRGHVFRIPEIEKIESIIYCTAAPVPGQPRLNDVGKDGGGFRIEGRPPQPVTSGRGEPDRLVRRCR
jgi:hypothetical protein